MEAEEFNLLKKQTPKQSQPNQNKKHIHFGLNFLRLFVKTKKKQIKIEFWSATNSKNRRSIQIKAERTRLLILVFDFLARLERKVGNNLYAILKINLYKWRLHNMIFRSSHKIKNSGLKFVNQDYARKENFIISSRNSILINFCVSEMFNINNTIKNSCYF